MSVSVILKVVFVIVCLLGKENFGLCSMVMSLLGWGW